jgi:hypothetical protein
MNLVTTKAAAKLELLFIKAAPCSLNTQVRLKKHNNVTKHTKMVVMNLATCKSAAMLELLFIKGVP